MNDRELIKIALAELTSKLGYSNNGSWRQRDVEHVSAEIEKASGILISVSTIRRLLNGQFSQAPQVATLNALAMYLGYGTWQQYRQQKHEAGNPEPVKPPVLRIGKNKRLARAVGIAAAVLVFVAIVAYTFFTKPVLNANAEVLFAVKRVTSSDIPNTVVFQYDVSGLQGDSFFIQQSWDRDRRVSVPKTGHTLTDIYYEPGYHNAKLIAGNGVVKTIEVSVPTNGWFFYSKPELFGGLPTYIRPAAAVQNGVLSLEVQDITNAKIDPGKENFYSYTYFPEKSEVSSDNFKMKMKMRLKEVKNVACPKVLVEIAGQTNALYFFTTLPGCTGEIDANVGEHFLDGKTTDLSGFGTDVRHWHDIEVIVKDKKADIFINKKKVFSQTYGKSYGKVTGLVLSSNALCEIDEIDLRGLDGKVFYTDTFDKAPQSQINQ